MLAHVLVEVLLGPARDLWMREVRKLSANGQQVSILSTNYQADYTALAVSMVGQDGDALVIHLPKKLRAVSLPIEHQSEAVLQGIVFHSSARPACWHSTFSLARKVRLSGMRSSPSSWPHSPGAA
jgi:hypothetical protein